MENMAQFGMPSLDDEAGTGSDTTATLMLARGAVGSLQEMAATQARRHAAKARADVWARRITIGVAIGSN
jgi:hypothetical protein